MAEYTITAADFIESPLPCYPTKEEAIEHIIHKEARHD